MGRNTEEEAWRRDKGRFSAKAKKAYLQWKRDQKRNAQDANDTGGEASELPDPIANATRAPTKGPSGHLSYKPLCRVYQDATDTGSLPFPGYLPVCDPEEVGYGGPQLGMPERPEWQGNVTSAEQLHKLEEDAFEEFKQHISRQYPDGSVSYYEGRLDFWRQLWRVLEMSDIALFLVDARNPLLHFPESLYHYATKKCQCQVVVLLNKSDLVTPAAVRQWREFFRARYPDIRVVATSTIKTRMQETFHLVMEQILQLEVRRSGMPVSVRDIVCCSVEDIWRESLKRNRPDHKRSGALTRKQHSLVEEGHRSEGPEGEGADQLEDHSIQPREDSTSGASDQEASTRSYEVSEQEGELEGELEDEQEGSEEDKGSCAHGENHNEGQPPPGLTLGGGHEDKKGARHPVVMCVVGEPNVGKSSTMNCFLGSHKVAVSSHPGRTRHYQTHYLMDQLVICDCPGLVFPRVGVALPLQVLFGSYPIARTKDLLGVVKYLAEHIWPRLHHILRLTKDEGAGDQLAATDEGHMAIGSSKGPSSGKGRRHGRLTAPPLCRHPVFEHCPHNQGERCDMGSAVNGVLASPGGRVLGEDLVEKLRGREQAYGGGVMEDQALHGSGQVPDTNGIWPSFTGHSNPEVSVRSETSITDACRLKEMSLKEAGACGVTFPSALPGPEDGDKSWTAVDLCQALARKRGWMTRKGNPDVQRSANWIVRGALAGRDGLVLSFLPPEAPGQCPYS